MQSSLTLHSSSSFFHFPTAGIINVIHCELGKELSSTLSKNRVVFSCVHPTLLSESNSGLQVLPVLYKQSIIELDVLPVVTHGNLLTAEYILTIPLDLYTFIPSDATRVLHLEGGHHKI